MSNISSRFRSNPSSSSSFGSAKMAVGVIRTARETDDLVMVGAKAETEAKERRNVATESFMVKKVKKVQ